MCATENPSIIRLSKLPAGKPTTFRLVPDPDDLRRLAGALDLIDLRKVRLEGTLSPASAQNWNLDGTLGATAVQPCSVTLAPVTTRIDVPIRRRYMADLVAPTETETEMPEDDSIEPLPQTVDLEQILTESLALALPDFPRAEGAEMEQAAFSAPGVAPMTDDEVKPFAGLAALKKSMQE